MRIGMGTIVVVDAQAHSEPDALKGIEAAFAAIAQVEALMHPTRDGSDLLALRQCAVGRALTIHAWTWEVLALARRLNQLSKGSFDPCLPDSAGRLTDLEFAAPHSVIPRRTLHLDLGGIAKGYAVDRALAALRTSGCHGGLVNAGGDLAVFGNRSHPVVIRTDSTATDFVDLKNGALATSDAGERSRPAEHRGYYHGVNHRAICRGRVTVGARRAAIADGLTKCLLIDGRDASSALLEIFQAHLFAWEQDPM